MSVHSSIPVCYYYHHQHGYIYIYTCSSSRNRSKISARYIDGKCVCKNNDNNNLYVMCMYVCVCKYVYVYVWRERQTSSIHTQHLSISSWIYITWYRYIYRNIPIEFIYRFFRNIINVARSHRLVAYESNISPMPCCRHSPPHRHGVPCINNMYIYRHKNTPTNII